LLETSGLTPDAGNEGPGKHDCINFRHTCPFKLIQPIQPFNKVVCSGNKLTTARLVVEGGKSSRDMELARLQSVPDAEVMEKLERKGAEKGTSWVLDVMRTHKGSEAVQVRVAWFMLQYFPAAQHRCVAVGLSIGV
jgi:hypothetical protein